MQWLILAVALVSQACTKKSPPAPHAYGGPPRPAMLLPVANLPLPAARAVAFQGRYAWVAQNLAGATLVDISSPDFPKITRRFEPNELQPLHLQVIQSPPLLVVADRFRGLVIWDVTDAEHPTSISETRLPGIATHLDLFSIGTQRFAAVACGGEGLTICDITDVRRPKIVARANRGTDYARRVAVAGNLLFLADNYDGGLKVFHIRDHAAIHPLFQVRLRGFCDSVAVRDGLIYCAYRARGTAVLRLRDAGVSMNDNPTTPILDLLCQIYRTKDDARDLLPLEDHWLVVANGDGGVDLYDVTNPATPLLAAEYQTSSTAMSVASRDTYLYVAAWDAGLVVLRRDSGSASAHF